MSVLSRRAPLSAAALGTALLVLAPGTARADAPILGTWTVPNGEKVDVRSCGGAFCTTVRTGLYKGKKIGRMTGSGNSYTGTVTDPTTDKTYEGTAEIQGDALTLKGCVAKIFCRSQVWTR